MHSLAYTSLLWFESSQKDEIGAKQTDFSPAGHEATGCFVTVLGNFELNFIRQSKNAIVKHTFIPKLYTYVFTCQS